MLCKAVTEKIRVNDGFIKMVVTLDKRKTYTFMQANRFKIINIDSCSISISDKEFNEYFKEVKE